MFHELGHFIAARLVGIRVEEFAFGFGPKLLTIFKRGDTEYTIHPFPLGGFVKLAAMEPGEEDVPDGFQAQSIWKRALVIFAGPFASLVLAALVFVALGVLAGYPTTTLENRVGTVYPRTEAYRSGLRAGDRVTAINGQKITRGEQMIDLIGDNPGKEVTLLIDRRGEQITKTATPRWLIQYLGAEWSFQEGAGVVTSFYADSAAEKAGIEARDKLVSIDGREIETGADMVAAIEAAGDKSTTVRVMRVDRMVTVEAKPAIQWVRFMDTRWIFPDGIASPAADARQGSIELGDRIRSINGSKIERGSQMVEALKSVSPGEPVRMTLQRGDETIEKTFRPGAENLAAIESSLYYSAGKLGFQPLPSLEKAGFGESLQQGLVFTRNLAMRVVQTLTSSQIKEDVGGPVMIARATAQSVALGPYWVVMMAGGLSMSLAIVNLIPIPVLDGGHLAILGLEAVRRKRLTREQMQAVQFVGLMMIFLLVIVVLWSDIFKITQGLAPR